MTVFQQEMTLLYFHANCMHMHMHMHTTHTGPGVQLILQHRAKNIRDIYSIIVNFKTSNHSVLFKYELRYSSLTNMRQNEYRLSLIFF